MTLFGVMLRGVMPGLADPEQGLSAFFTQTTHPILTGLAFAFVYAIIASTANSIIVAIAQIVQRDFPAETASRDAQTSLTIVFLVGAATVALAFVLPGTVYSLVLGSVSTLSAAIAGAVIIKTFAWKHDAVSLLSSIVCGFAAGTAWSMAGYAKAFNEAGIGIAVALCVNAVIARMRAP
jgi:Na+/proline symporter